jgi:predicted amidohydrolase YtcJ
MDQAVEYYSMGSAYAEFADTQKGSLTEGKLADMVLLSQDVFTIASRDILNTVPVYTIVGGRIVYEQK